MINAAKILEEAERFQRFLAGGDTGLTEDELHRQERYHHALDLIKKYSPFENKAKKIHADRFASENGTPLPRRTADSDFFIAFQLLGKEGMFSKDSMRNWLIYKGMKALGIAMDNNDSKVVPKLLHELYLLSDLNKDNVELPDFKNYEFPELRFALHPESLEMKNSPKILEEFMRELLKPKGSKNFEEAIILGDE